MDNFLNKTYKLERSDNMEALLAELGLNPEYRKGALELRPTLLVTKTTDGSYTLTSTSSQTFKLGVGRDITTQDGRKINIVFTVEGNKLIEKQVGEKALSVTREFSADQVISTATIGNVVCTSWFKIVA